MKPPNHPAIRAYLRKYVESGASVKEIAANTGLSTRTVRRSLSGMPDVYVDRWNAPVRGQYQAVYCIVVPPPNCPHPDDRHVRSSWNRKFYIPKEMRNDAHHQH